VSGPIIQGYNKEKVLNAKEKVLNANKTGG